jgi:DNA-binding transcriptional ArsR family regulator
MRTPARTLVSRLDQMSALASPVRLELIDALARMGQASLAELAQALGRPADGLYYHVRALQKVGLVRPAGSRTRAGRREAVVRSTAREYALRYAAMPAAHARAVNGIVAGIMRLGARDFRRALATGTNRVEGPARDLWALRATGWLTRADLADANRRMRQLKTAVSRPGPGGRLYAITILLTPVDHPARASRRKAADSPGRKPRP